MPYRGRAAQRRCRTQASYGWHEGACYVLWGYCLQKAIEQLCCVFMYYICLAGLLHTKQHSHNITGPTSSSSSSTTVMLAFQLTILTWGRPLCKLTGSMTSSNRQDYSSSRSTSSSTHNMSHLKTLRGKACLDLLGACEVPCTSNAGSGLSSSLHQTVCLQAWALAKPNADVCLLSACSSVIAVAEHCPAAMLKDTW